ncbi:hypothetical protein O7627_16600 [Solwaraspora sp. WMMD1047]|uniref:hypothetical protein n=1 Tax=Solwaraspora sp. WMMD1047 TaxID=3016102 RepID=UPI0024165BF3|nr:hypothetical protein [Solwaraspora sp. WMMD1047]MDG4830916.1 hypothetical protein [Solwaraspora sp. WMMD1047]
MATVTQRTASPYRSRPGRLAVVVDDLAELVGPTHGLIELPHRLLWRPDRVVDLDQSWQLRSTYETVLTEAIRADELRAWLDRVTLIRVWDELYLPRGVRRAWEERHHVLRRLPTVA